MRALALVALLLWPTQAVDDAVRAFAQDTRSPAVEPWMRTVSGIGKPAVVLGVFLAVACFTGPAGPATAREALAALAGTNLVVEGLKRGTYRARPDGEHKRSNAAFPSSHAANAFAVAWVLARRWRRATVPAFAAAAVIAASRVYLDRHWLSDVVVGAGVGCVMAWAAARWLVRRRALRTESNGG